MPRDSKTQQSEISGRDRWARPQPLGPCLLRRHLGVLIGPGQQYVDTYGDYLTMSEVDESGALLVRPDMFVGWRAFDSSVRNTDQLFDAMKTILRLI